MPIKLLIGINGPYGSGKTTLAQSLHYAMPDIVRTHSFASRLKSDLQNLTGIRLDESTKRDYRVGLQWYGVFMRTHIHEDYWVEKLLQQIEQSWDSAFFPVVVVVDDMRFPNEKSGLAAWAEKRDIPFVSIKLSVGKRTQAERRGVVDEATAQHTSETALLNDFDFDIFVNTDFWSAEGVSNQVLAHLMSADILDESLRLKGRTHESHLLPDTGGASSGVQGAEEGGPELPGD